MNLLERTRRLLQGLASPAPSKVQYYSVTCPEGHRLRGERTEGYQALRCPTCGEGIFVLPRSPLPEPAAAHTPRTVKGPPAVEPIGRELPYDREDEPIALSDPVVTRPASDADADVDGEIEWLEPGPAGEPPSPSEASAEGPDGTDDDFAAEAAAEAEAAAQARTVARPAARKPAAEPPRGRPRRDLPGRPVPAPRARPRSERLAAWARTRRNPLIFLAVGLIVVGTVGVRAWRSRFQDLPRIAERGRVEGLAALDAGEFDTAHKLLSEARRAVEALDDAVEGAAEIRHGAEEAALFTSLIADPLEVILKGATADAQDETWSQRFETLYKGRALLVIDAMVTSVPGSADSGSYELDYLVLPSGEGSDPRGLRIGRLDLTGFQLFEQARPKLGDVVRFGARLASLELDTGSETWRFGLEPDSGVFLTHPEALQALRGTSAEDEAGDAAP